MNRLVAVRPDATTDFEYCGVTFKIGVIPRHIYSKYVDIGMKAGRGKSSGEELFNCQCEVVQWGVKDHSGFFFDEAGDEEVKFKKKKVVNKYGTNHIMDDETLQIYYASGLIGPLSTRIFSGSGENPEEEPDT